MNSRISRRKFLAASAVTLAGASHNRAADKEELPDYETLLNEKLRRDITPDRNANALLWRALGPAPEGEAWLPADACFEWLGIEKPPEKGNYFVNISTFHNDHLKADPDEVGAIHEQLTSARERPWKAAENLPIAAWLKLNHNALGL